jgi:hypothetical protein
MSPASSFGLWPAAITLPGLHRSSFLVRRSSLSSGIYVLKLVTENSSTTEKLVIE